MSNTYTALHFHVVFSTKDREPWIRHEIEDRVWKFIAGIARENEMKSLRIGGMPDHVHMVISLPPALSLSKAIQHLKGGSSKWMKTAFPELRNFSWQDGYAAFSVSKSNLPQVLAYVEGQREHHRTKSFQDEYRAFLKRHAINFDERYL
jgi:putative transposase